MTRPIVWMYLGRRGAMARFTRDLAREIGAGSGATFLVSQHNELSAALRETEAELRFAPVFSRGVEAFQLWRLHNLQHFIRRSLSETGAGAVVELMPHLWSPFIERTIRDTGARRISVLHDWHLHPGDLSGLATRWLAHSAARADKIITLSRFVGSRLRAAYPDLQHKLVELFHPDFPVVHRDLPPMRPLRALFIGRLLPYKGLDLFVDAAERARARGIDLKIGVFGEGDISHWKDRLSSLGAEVVNRWLSDEEIDEAIARYHLVAATYREASQSGVVAAALGAGRPTIVTPVGALPEQIQHGQTGLVAAMDADSIADAFARFSDRTFLGECADAVRAGAEARSMRAFARAVRRVVEAD